jgi:hypothetical protein
LPGTWCFVGPRSTEGAVTGVHTRYAAVHNQLRDGMGNTTEEAVRRCCLLLTVMTSIEVTTTMMIIREAS